MPHDVSETADHGGAEVPGGSAEEVPSVATGPGFVPLAQPIATPVETPEGFIPDPEGPETFPGLPLPHTFPRPWPWPGLHLCNISLPSGCYRITFQPKSGFTTFNGTMRVDDHGGTITISGDLYRYFNFPFPFPPIVKGPDHVEWSRPITFFPIAYGIPVYPRNRYFSYLRVTSIQRPPILTVGTCRLTLTAQEYVYTQPPAGSFNGTFPAAPGSRTVTIVLEAKPAPSGFSGSYFAGTLSENGVVQGTFTMGWVSSYFRKATLEIDTLTGSVAPQAVAGETFKTVFGTAGWDLNVVYDQVNVPVPAGVTATACWSDGNLHNLMSAIRNPATNLDAEWHMHLLVVPAAMNCGRGVMYDQIGVPREGVASFSDDGYPTGQSANFGTAANQLQRNVPRAFLRSASHEVAHGFNQIHQEQEGGADNSIMTTTPSVADVLGGPATGDPGVFPDQINLGFNEHVRHHLVHFPDITVRPGGMTFGSGHSSTVPEADRYFFEPSELEIDLDVKESHIELGEPLELAWVVKNVSGTTLPVPTDIGVEAQHATVTVTDPRGRRRAVPSFVIRTDHVSIGPLEADANLAAETRVFWSSLGFAFPEPGKYAIEVRIAWAYGGAPLGVKTTTDVFVNFPQTEADNRAAAELLHPEVGMYVALGGGAPHLTDAVERIQRVATLGGEGDQAGAKVLRGYRDLMPETSNVARAGDATAKARPRGH